MAATVRRARSSRRASTTRRTSCRTSSARRRPRRMSRGGSTDAAEERRAERADDLRVLRSTSEDITKREVEVIRARATRCSRRCRRDSTSIPVRVSWTQRRPSRRRRVRNRTVERGQRAICASWPCSRPASIHLRMRRASATRVYLPKELSSTISTGRPDHGLHDQALAGVAGIAGLLHHDVPVLLLHQ